MDTRRIKIASIVVALFFFIAAVARSQQITEQGVTDFPWLNATTGLGAPSAYLTDPDPIIFNNTVIEKDALLYPTQPASYIIWRSGSTYYAKNGTTGAIDYSGTNASMVIQSALDTLHTLGEGQAILRAGHYSLDVSLSVYGYITIKGEGIDETFLELANGVNDDVIKFEGTALTYFFAIRDLTIDGNSAQQTAGRGIDMNVNMSDGLVHNVFVKDTFDEGIYLDYVWGWRVSHSVIEHCADHGIYFAGGTSGLIIGTKVADNDGRGLMLYAHNCRIVDSEFGQNGVHGININGDDNLVSNCHIYNNGQDTINTYSGLFVLAAAERTLISSNKFDGANQEKYGIVIQAGSQNTRIIGCKFRRHATAPVSDSGTYTELPTLTLSFVDGTAFSSSAPFGWEIDANTEYAIAIGKLPSTVQQIIRWEIWATANVTEADAMRLEITGYGGASNEAYTTETVTIVNKASTTTNFAQGDIIYWTLKSSDDTDLDDMLGGDAIMIKVLHEVAGGADCETDAIFLCVEIDYV